MNETPSSAPAGTPLTPGPIPDDLVARSSIERIAASLTDYIGAHQLVFGDDGEIVDARLIWWNPAYERIRLVPVEYGQSMMDTYFAPEVARDYVRRAYRTGSVEQVFRLEAGTVDRYRMPDQLVDIHVDWLRVGSLVVEVGSDHSEVMALEQRLDDQERETTAAVREHRRDLDRQRVARRLHDSAIQQLFATALDLQTLATADGDVDAEALHRALTTIEQVIDDIRGTIFEIEPDGDR